jgi:septum formation protein
MPKSHLVLASASPARLRLLQAAGIEPEVVVSHVVEEDADATNPRQMVATLARRKALAVAARRPARPAGAARGAGEVVLGCDSALDVDGRAYGKPATAEEALHRWVQLRGRNATLLTGHYLLDTATGRNGAGVAATVVRFGRPTDEELHAYVGSGEPLAVAGAFTLDGRSAPFIDGIDGDPSNVIGCSLPLVRRLLRALGHEWTSLWV